jgi:hypothetical protein
MNRHKTAAIIFALVAIMMAAGPALAAKLTPSDDRYLQSEYGLSPDSEIIKDLSADEQSKLHDFINDPAFRQYPSIRDHNVADFLFTSHMRECNVWALSHGAPDCPPTSDAGAEPGKEIADRQCNACHLFGTMDAPSFHKLAADGKLNAQGLADSLSHGHSMSPITLPSAQISELIVYIRSLK